MAANSLQPGGAALMLTHPVPSFGNGDQRTLAPDQVLWGESNAARGSSIAAILPVEASWNGNNVGTLHSRSAARQDLLCGQFSLNPTLSWDNRQDIMNSRSTDWKQTESQEVLCLNTSGKPGRVHGHFAALETQLSPSSNSTLLYNPPRIAGCQSYEALSSGPEEAVLNWSSISSQELLWRQFFLDPSLWRDNRQHKKSSRTPDFRHKETKEVIWLKDSDEPAWVDAQLASLDAQTASTSNSTSLHDAGYRRDLTAETVSNLSEKGQLREAVDALDLLVQADSRVSVSLFYSVIKRCVAYKDLVLGRRVHDLIVKIGYGSNTFLSNHILRMYSSHGRLEEAMDVFLTVAEPDAFMWSSIVSAHAKHGAAEQAVQLYHQMRSTRVKPDSHVFVAALQACATAADLESGRQVHADVLECGVQPNLFVLNCLVDMYAKCGKLLLARTIFDSLVTRDVVTWNAMIAGYANHEQTQEALSLYEQMEGEGAVLADTFTFACLLKALARVGAIQQGRQLHTLIVARGLESDTVVGNCLVDMYVKCGRLGDARSVFDRLPTRDVVTWTAMIAGYAEHEQCSVALALYEMMEQEGMVIANTVTFACLLKACTRAGALQHGKQLHSQILERGLGCDTVVGNCLVDMYAKCGSLEDARRVFDSLQTKDVVTWTAMIAAYAEHEHGQDALSLYEKMEQDGVVVADPVTFACLVKACASLGALQQGKQLHSQILERGLEADTFVGNSLVDMYAKFGRLKDARRVFDSLPTKDVVTWTMMINGFGQSNEGHKAIQCFQEMMRNGVEANATTFTCLLVACSHDGLVEEGRQLFTSMVEECGIRPTVEHHNCMVDLLGRAGYLDEAEKILLSYENNDVGFMSLLNACKCHGDLERGMRCFESLMRSDFQNAGAYVLMGNIYADAGRWSDVERIESLRKAAGANKKAAVAGIEVDKHVHTFAVGEERGDISVKVRSVNSRLREEGSHVPHTELVLKRASEEEKEDDLCGHAEKLALAYGLVNTPDGTPLLITKNLRMCGDCHSSTEIMSRIEKREIIVRDAHRIHRFVDGSCHCGGRP